MVALIMNNRPEWLLIDFAVTMLGATLVPLSTWSRPRELEYMLTHCAASTLLTIPRFGSQDYLAALGELGGPGGSRLPHLRRIVVAGDTSAGGETRSDLVTLESLPDLGRDVSDDELAAA